MRATVTRAAQISWVHVRPPVLLARFFASGYASASVKVKERAIDWHASKIKPVVCCFVDEEASPGAPMPIQLKSFDQ